MDHYLCFSFSNFPFYAMLAWLAPMVLEFGSSPKRADLILGAFTVAFMFRNIAFGV
jgi:cyanate permease